MSKDSFKNRILDSSYSGIELPISQEWANTTDRSGWLRIHALRTGLVNPIFHVVSKQILGNHITASTKLEFDPKDNFQQAGLVAFFDIYNWYFLYLTLDPETQSICLQIQSSSDNEVINHLRELPDLQKAKSVQLKISLEDDKILFYYSSIKHRWHKVGASLSTKTLMDRSNVTKIENKLVTDKDLYIGMGLRNTSDKDAQADFDYFNFVIHE